MAPGRQEGTEDPFWAPPCHIGAGRKGLVPDFQEAVPRTSGHGHAIVRHTQTADAVVVASKDPCKGRGQGCQGSWEGQHTHPCTACREPGDQWPLDPSVARPPQVKI